MAASIFRLFCVSFVVIACVEPNEDGTGDAGDFADCELGDFTGDKRVQYEEIGGSCGEVPAETVDFDPGGDPPEGCDYTEQIVSDDRCEADIAFECPTADELGTQAWTMRLVQTGAERLEGTATLSVSHLTLGACESTYDVTVVGR